MDELKNLWNTGTGKVLITIVTALILFLASLSYKGLFSDTNESIKKNKTLIDINKANIKANTNAINTIRTFTEDNIKSINSNINSINTKLSNIDGYIKGVEKGEQKKR